MAKKNRNKSFVQGLLESEEGFRAEIEAVSKRDKVFWEGLDNESDRAVVLCAACHFEHLLERCLQCYFLEDSQSVDILASELGPANAKIRLCRALRIISEDEQRDLVLVFRIRNAIAHDIMKDFSDEGIQQRVKLLEDRLHPVWEASLPDGHTPRRSFRLSCLLLSLELQWREIDVGYFASELPDLLPRTISEDARRIDREGQIEE